MPNTEEGGLRHPLFLGIHISEWAVFLLIVFCVLCLIITIGSFSFNVVIIPREKISFYCERKYNLGYWQTPQGINWRMTEVEYNQYCKRRL